MLFIKRQFTALVVVLFLGIASTSANANDDHVRKGPTILDRVVNTDGAQAVVAAVLIVDEAKVLDFSLAELLSDRKAEVVLLAPSNAAFETLLGLPPGTLNGLTVDEIKAALPGLLPPDVGVEEIAAILLKHASLPRFANFITSSENALLRKGKIEVADGSTFTIGIGRSGVQINYEATIIKPNIFAVNGILHFIDTVIVDDLL